MLLVGETGLRQRYSHFIHKMAMFPYSCLKNVMFEQYKNPLPSIQFVFSSHFFLRVLIPL
jgi:hypothetical protein